MNQAYFQFVPENLAQNHEKTMDYLIQAFDQMNQTILNTSNALMDHFLSYQQRLSQSQKPQDYFSAQLDWIQKVGSTSMDHAQKSSGLVLEQCNRWKEHCTEMWNQALAQKSTDKSS